MKLAVGLSAVLTVTGMNVFRKIVGKGEKFNQLDDEGDAEGTKQTKKV